MLKLVLTNISYGSMIIQSKGVLTGGECLFLCAGLCRERTGLVVMIKENGYGEEELYEG